MRTITTITAAVIAVAVLALPSAAAAPEFISCICITDANIDPLLHQQELAVERAQCDLDGDDMGFQNAFLRPENRSDTRAKIKCAKCKGSISTLWLCFGV